MKVDVTKRTEDAYVKLVDTELRRAVMAWHTCVAEAALYHLCRPCAPQDQEGDVSVKPGLTMARLSQSIVIIVRETDAPYSGQRR